METLESKTFGFGFAIEELEDGTLTSIKVVDRWCGQPRWAHYKPVQSLTIRLRPYASYAEAMEIANYLNAKLITTFSPVIEVNGGAA